MTTEATRKWSNFAWTALTYILVFLLVFPVLWMALTGFKTEIAAINIPPILFFQPTLDQFLLAIEGGFGAYLFNSVVAALVSTALALVLGIPAAYAMVFHMTTKSSNDMLFFVLSTRFMPFAAILVPLYVIITRLNLLDKPLHVNRHLYGDEPAFDHLDGPFVLPGTAKRGVGGSLARWLYDIADNCEGRRADGSTWVNCSGTAGHHFCLERFLLRRHADLYQLTNFTHYGCGIYE